MSRPLTAAASIAMLASCASAHAQETSRLTIDASATAGYSNNPFSDVGADLDSGLVEVNVRPRLEIRSSTDVVTLSGFANIQEYFRLYPTATSYGGEADYRGMADQDLSLHGVISYESRILGTRAGGSVIGDPLLAEPIDFIDPIGTDVGLFGTRDRQNKLAASGDFEATLSPRAKLTGNLFGAMLRYRNFGALGDYDAFGGGLGYNRVLSERTTVGLVASAAAYDYRGARGDAVTYTLQGRWSQRLNTAWKVDVALGATYIDEQLRGGSTALSGNVNLCSEGARDSFCLIADRSVLPTAVSGTQTQTSVTANYRYRINERSNLAISTGYADFGDNELNILGGNRYATATVSYDRSLTQMFNLTSSAFYREVLGGTLSRPADYGARIGVAYQFGGNR